VPAERDQVVGARLGALIAHDARLRPGTGLGLQPQHAAESRRRGAPFGRILKRKRRLGRVFQRDPQALQEIDEEYRFQERNDGLHQARSPITVGSESPCQMTRSLRGTSTPANLVLQPHQP
jgi:hypothetical protein